MAGKPEVRQGEQCSVGTKALSRAQEGLQEERGQEGVSPIANVADHFPVA